MQATTKVHLVQFVKQTLLLILFSGLVSSKTASPEKGIASKSIAVDELELNALEGKWYDGKSPYNGFAESYYPSGKLKSKIGFYEGKRFGIAKQWYENGLLKKETNYVANRKDGTEQLWNSKGMLIKKSSFRDGIVEGVQLEWYATGEPFKKMNISNGKEEGLQQVWWKNGKPYVNYEAKNGRVFGLKRSTLCYELENEIVQK